jgi:hypothetical protein
MAVSITTLYIECHYAECHDLFIVILNVIILIDVNLNVVAPHKQTLNDSEIGSAEF